MGLADLACGFACVDLACIDAAASAQPTKRLRPVQNSDGPSIGQLRAFEAVLRERSFSKAAKELRLTQPALTRSIAKLEAAFGIPLFERRAAGTVPNENGLILGRRITRFIDQFAASLDLPNTSKRPAAERAVRVRGVHIRSLLAIWRLGSFRAAAAALGISDSSLHRPAREIEQIAGARLYRRSASGVVVTPVGAELARRFALAMSEIDSARDEIGISITQRPAIRIGVLPLTPRRFLSAATELALRQDTQRRIEIVEGSYPVLSQQVQDGRLDILFGALPPGKPGESLVEEPLVEDPYVVVCRSGHPLARKERLPPENLRGYGWIHPSASLPRRSVVDNLLRTWGLDAQVEIETDSLTMTISMLFSTDRVTILSQWHVGDRSGLVRLHLPPVPHAPRLVGMTSRSNWLPTPFQQNFLSLLKTELKDWNLSTA